jgi:polyisoprenyl-phosphate glycosyltransferase
MDVSVVIPTYNSELIIDKLVNKISLDTVSSYEIIVVNDKSKDNTFQKLKRIKNETPNLKIINLKENIGQVGATLVGVQNAKGEIIVTMDDDLQHNPKYIEQLINKIQDQNYEIVIAKWGLDETITRNLGSYFFSVLSSLLVLKSINFRNTAFRAFKKERKEDFVNFFISRYWIDPRRLSAKVCQINLPHQNQNFRPYSSFQSRITLAIKHIVFDSYLVQLALVFLFFRSFLLLGSLLIIFTLLQYLIRYFLRKKRLSA